MIVEGGHKPASCINELQIRCLDKISFQSISIIPFLHEAIIIFNICFSLHLIINLLSFIFIYYPNNMVFKHVIIIVLALKEDKDGNLNLNNMIRVIWCDSIHLGYYFYICTNKRLHGSNKTTSNILTSLLYHYILNVFI